MKRPILYILAAFCWAAPAQNTPDLSSVAPFDSMPGPPSDSLPQSLFDSTAGPVFDPAAHATFQTGRPDGRFVSSRAVAHQLMKKAAPALGFPTSLRKEDFPVWQQQVREAMARLMKHPVIQNLPAPVRISVQQRHGYRLEKWEAYPLPDCAVPYLVLIPDRASDSAPAPAVLCIPGWGGSKEELAGEPEINTRKEINTPTRNAMAWKYVQEGWIAVAVDNPGSGEAADLERQAEAEGYDFQTFARALLELDWNYLGYSSYVSLHILNWMKEQPAIRPDRLIVSGFSFGTEPLMVLGALDPSIYAFVYNDFLCRTRERALVMTMPDANGRRPWPNDISHLVPGFLRCFDFPDLVANLAPRPVICTEGGADRDLRLVKNAYECAGQPGHFTYYHYKAFEKPEQRTDFSDLPEGLDRDTYFRLVNVDPGNHYFKAEYVIPWIKKILSAE